MAHLSAHSHRPAGRLTRPLMTVASALSLSIAALPTVGRAQADSAAIKPTAFQPNTPSAALEQFAALELTTEQRKSIDSLAYAGRAAREKLLGDRGRPPARTPSDSSAPTPSIGLNISETERAELQRLSTDFEAALQRILTPAQRQKLVSAREAMRARHAAQAEAAAKEAYANRPTKPPADLKLSAPSPTVRPPESAAPAAKPR